MLQYEPLPAAYHCLPSNMFIRVIDSVNGETTDATDRYRVAVIDVELLTLLN